MNVILIVIDTLRYDYATSPRLRRTGIGDAFGLGAKTPHIDRLAEKSWRFDRHFAASFPTIPHRTDVMTGRSGSPVHPWLPLRFDVPTLPRAFAEAGYATQLIHDTPHLVNGGHNFDWPFHAWTQVRGAEVDRPWITSKMKYLDNWKPDPIFDTVEGDPFEVNLIPAYVAANRARKSPDDWNAARLFSTAAECVRDNAVRDNLFLWVDCFDPHEPWDAPREFMKRYVDAPGYDGTIDPRSFCVAGTRGDYTDAVVERVRAAYAAKVSWVDHCLGKLFDAVDDADWWEKTVILLTSDHGTRMYERGRFAKSGSPIHEEVAHTPLFVYAPGIGTGRCDAVCQPQDIFATLAGIAGVQTPEGIDSHDVLAPARQGKPSPRKIALTSIRADSWGKIADRGIASVFDADWCLELRLTPETSTLTRLGSTEDVAADNPDVVKRLHAEALDEIERRGADQAIVTWLRSAGEKPFPKSCRFFDGWPPPKGYAAYFTRLYKD